MLDAYRNGIVQNGCVCYSRCIAGVGVVIGVLCLVDSGAVMRRLAGTADLRCTHIMLHTGKHFVSL